jgi:hypothetical protein
MRRQITQYISQKQGTILMLTLSFVILLFIAILVAIYIAAKRANPIILDENGRPVNAQLTRSLDSLEWRQPLECGSPVPLW